MTELVAMAIVIFDSRPQLVPIPENGLVELIIYQITGTWYKCALDLAGIF